MIRWLWAFIDRPADRFDTALDFWTAVTGSTLSPRRGAHDEFVTLLPRTGDPYLKAQAVGGAGGIHIDLDVDDIAAAATRAEKLGATQIYEHRDYRTFRSPQGQVFCLTPDKGYDIPAPSTAPNGILSKLDQICIDIGPSGYADEIRFWAELTGWELQPSPLPEFTRLIPDRPMPVRILLQRLAEERPAAAHLDLACADYAGIAHWHEQLGARRVRDGGNWVVMADPTGAPYCLTGRDPQVVHGRDTA